MHELLSSLVEVNPFIKPIAIVDHSGEIVASIGFEPYIDLGEQIAAAASSNLELISETDAIHDKQTAQRSIPFFMLQGQDSQFLIMPIRCKSMFLVILQPNFELQIGLAKLDMHRAIESLCGESK